MKVFFYYEKNNKQTGMDGSMDIYWMDGRAGQMTHRKIVGSFQKRSSQVRKSKFLFGEDFSM